ncbi:MAG: hypothetical protein HUJ63_05635 [Enterococcus sp.]|nr:hypothetical protein [Enterococcus sp.]
MYNYCAIKFFKKSGKIKQVLDSGMCSTLNLYALQNCTKTTDWIIFDKDTGEVLHYVEGTDSYPRSVPAEELRYAHIEDFCAGLLDAINEI